MLGAELLGRRHMYIGACSALLGVPDFGEGACCIALQLIVVRLCKRAERRQCPGAVQKLLLEQGSVRILPKQGAGPGRL